MMGSILVAVAVFGPLIGAIGVVILRPVELGAGRGLAASCGVASIASFAILIMSGLNDDGLVGDVAGLGLRVDRASAVLLAVASATGVVVASFARRNVDLDPRAGRFFALFGVLVTGSALVVVPGGPLALVAGWLVSSWALIGLVGHRSELTTTRRAQRRVTQALLGGDAALVLASAIAVSVSSTDVTRDVGAVLGDLQSTSLLGVSAADVVALLVVVAGASRSALLPFHRWLVATLAAPTPVSALVHAGFVSGAGLLLIRFGPIVLASSVAVHLAFGLAVVTVVVAAGAGKRRVDVKGKLAWSTVAQMGFMVVQCTVGAFTSAVFHIAGHGMYKASMFLGAGDAISASLRSSRRAAPLPLAPTAWRATATGVVTTLTVIVGLSIIPPDVNDAGVVLIVVFTWLTVANGVWGWLARGASVWPRSVAESAAAAFVAVLAYLGGLRAVEFFLKPTFGPVVDDLGVDTATLVVTLAIVAIVAAGGRFVSTPSTDRARRLIGSWLHRTAHPAVAGDLPLRTGIPAAPTAPTAEPPAVVEIDGTLRSKIRADVSRAANVIAPTWPLSSVVAVNPLGGLEGLGFEAATKVARRQLRARTHLSLEEFRRDHTAGQSSDEDLHWAIESHYLDLCTMPPIVVDGRTITMREIIEIDLLHGPEIDEPLTLRTAVERIEGAGGASGDRIDASICHSVAQFVADTQPNPGRRRAFVEQWATDATSVAAVRQQLTSDAVEWLHALGTDPAGIIANAFVVLSIGEDARIDEMRGHLARLQGWAGYAKWRSEWAHPEEERPVLGLIDLVAARCALEAACMISNTIESAPAVAGDERERSVQARADAVAAVCEVTDSDARAEIAQAVALINPSSRNEAWLRAQERQVDRTLLTTLDRLDPGPSLRDPEAQLVFCIDVRSEGLRRQLEAVGPYDTLGFAGFFGVAMAVRHIEWDHSEARCPVLVTPSAHATEQPAEGFAAATGVDRMLARDRRLAGATSVHGRVKSGFGASYVMAEAVGWVAGPRAAVRTLLPGRRTTVERPPTVIGIDRDADAPSDLAQRIFLAEAVLRTMGLTQGFAPLVVLCGHTSHNVNNPHATSLECGACAGASGQDNARVVANLLNDPEVRDGLREREIDIPDATRFAAGLHDTVSDTVEILDRLDIPSDQQARLEQLMADLADAAARQSGRRAHDLPGPATAVQRRGADWAQVRPEWGLARNAGFIIGPRSMTAGLDLEGRAFLHTYDADADPDGKVLETIMTAPLVVAHWISSQYYFSTVDPEVFGAGDKLIHNVVADTGVISGEHGDIRVGLPYQSTHVGTDRHHQPVRLLAVVQAPLERIEEIIARNPILTTLTAGSWLRIAGRSHPHERWSLRTPNGTWQCEPRSVDLTNTLETP